MGTKVHCNTYLPGYYSMRNLNEDTGNGSRPLYHEDKTLKSGQYYNTLFPRPSIDGYLGYDKELLRQTILKHESIFRHQLHELHRLYRMQRDLMNEIKRNELCKHLLPAETSKSNIFSSHIPSEDAKKMWDITNIPLVNSSSGRHTMSGTDSMSGPVPARNGVSLKECVSFESKCEKYQRRLFDLELPADEYINNEGEQLEERVSGVSGRESCFPNGNGKITRGRDVNLGSSMNPDSNGDALRSNMYSRRTHGLTDLNEPIQVEEASGSASVDILGNISCSEGIQRRDLPVDSNSVSQWLDKKFFQDLHKGRDKGASLNNLPLENERSGKEWLSYNFEAGHTRSNKNSFPGGFCPEDSPMSSESLQVEPRKVHKPLMFLPSDQSKSARLRKRTIFGVEISERNDDLSVVASHTGRLHPRVPQSDVAISESSSVSSWGKLPISSSPNPISVQGLPCFNASAPSNTSSKTLIQSPEFVGDRLHLNNHSRSIPSFRAEVSYQNGFCLGSQLKSKALQICCPSIGFDYRNGNGDNKSVSEQYVQNGPTKYFKGSDCMHIKSVKEMNMDVVPPNRFQDEVIPQQNPVSVDGRRKYENLQGAFPWLKAKPLCNGELTEGRGNAYQMKLESLENYYQQFANKTEMEKGHSQSLNRDSTSSICDRDAEHKRIEVGDRPSNGKILGFPLFDKPRISVDLTSPRSPGRSSCLASEIDGDDSGKDLARDPKSGELLEVEDRVIEKGLDNYISGLKHHIDLNLCLNEEEAPSTISLPRAIVKIATTEIDLEAPVVLETEVDISPGGESIENQLKKPSKWFLDESKGPHEELVRVAAEAIVGISSSYVRSLPDDATCHPLEASPSDSLHWFAEVIASYMGDLESEVGAVSTGKDGAGHEESISNGIDYFEFMTLKLTDTKVETCCYKPPALEDPKDEETGATLLPKRPRKGQARRGRQRRDFQRDILPGLTSLAKHEVTEDLQTIEALFSATGCTWQSGLTRRNTARSGGGRGRRRSGGSAPSTTLTAVCPPPMQQPNYREPGLEKTSLTGWGKRTRRPPRQRCLIGNPSLPLK